MNDSKMWHKRLPEFEAFDSITLDVIPRYKTSDLSGCEWRHSVVATFYFKGEAVAESAFRDMGTALLMLGGELLRNREPIPSRVIEIERESCDQPSCGEKAVSVYVLKKEYVRGEEIVPPANGTKQFRKFCTKHLRRGDSDMEDCDANYEVVSGPGPEASTNLEESPARLVMVDVDSVEDIPAAIEKARGR